MLAATEFASRVTTQKPNPTAHRIMRPNVRAFVDAAARSFHLRGPIYEFGSYLVEGQDGLGDLRDLFNGQPYIGCDMRNGPGVDQVVDLAALPLADDTARTIICVDTLEHVFEVSQAVREMIRVLQPGGVLLISVPMNFRVHAYPDDYWRLTPSCLARLLTPLEASLIGSQGVESHPHTVFGIACKGPIAAEFPGAANRFLSAFQEQAAELAAEVPWMRRATNHLRGLFCGKGERRERREFHQTRFVVNFPRAAACQSGPISDSTPPGKTGTRLDLME